MADTVLLITEDRSIAKKVRDACRETEAILTHLSTLKDATEELAATFPDLILCDYATFEAVRDQHPRACVLLYTEPTDSEHAIEAIKRGALDYLVTPIETKILAQHIREALRVSRDIHVPAVYEEPDDDVAVERIIGQSPAMREVYKLIGRIAPRDVNVLITGESGTGKELIARAILHHSPRKDQPFLAVNCAAIPETLIESELFGHEKGAFTGATLRRVGKFEQCDGGTLFLDEIGDIPLATQAKLLRVLQDNSFQRLGGTELITSDVRIIGATHQPLEVLIAEERFRQDLYFRLKVASIDVPPLREREIDALILAHQFVRRYNRSLNADIRSFSPDVHPVLLKYPWPGNVRELENAIKAALVVARGTVFRLEFLPEHIRKGGMVRSGEDAGAQQLVTDSPAEEARAVAEKLASQPSLGGKLHEAATSMIEREIIRVALGRCVGQLAPAARLLGISRTTLRKKMAAHGIRTTTSVELDA
ncbi:MAG: sigma-54-dependent Fis family transcriptional regulator [Phycisphaerales bacterium]|nr:MAG: sigma-54-dependent Fis family transcriptional regulator [Phycisphaerales bacterium]